MYHLTLKGTSLTPALPCTGLYLLMPWLWLVDMAAPPLAPIDLHTCSSFRLFNVSIDPPFHSLPGCSASSFGNSSLATQRFMSLSINLVLFRSSCPGLLPTPVPCVQINSASSLCPPPPLILPANHSSTTCLQSITPYKSQPTLSFCNTLKTKPWLQLQTQRIFYSWEEKNFRY